MAPSTIVKGQISEALPQVSATITAHDEETRQAIFYDAAKQTSTLTSWHKPIDNLMSFFTLYQTSTVPVDPTRDLVKHMQVMSTAADGPPLVVENGTVCRLVDFAPGYTTVSHRTRSVDYGVVVEGQIELVLDSGETRLIDRGGMVVQRGTMHKWRNPSVSVWARMFFVLIASKPVVIRGQALEEDAGGL